MDHHAMKMRSLAASTTLGVLAALTPVTAHAASTTFRSPVTEGRPEDDLRRVTVDNGENLLSVTFKLRDLSPSTRSKVELVYTPRGADAPYVVRLRRSAEGETVLKVVLSDGAHGNAGTIACPAMTGTWNFARNTIRTTVPQSCFEQNARRASVKAMAGYFTDTGPGDFTGFRTVLRG